MAMGKFNRQDRVLWHLGKEAGLKKTHGSRQASHLQLCCLSRALELENPHPAISLVLPFLP